VTQGFVSLKALVGKNPKSPAEILQEIRDIYFKTTKQTIHDDFAHAIELLKSLPDEEAREKATVYMEGIAQMGRDWAKVRGQRSKVKGQVEGKGKGKGKGARPESGRTDQRPKAKG
jgi:hypothetical protein